MLSALLLWGMTIMAQAPSILINGRANSEDGRKWVEEIMSDMTLKEKNRTVVYSYSGSAKYSAKQEEYSRCCERI